MLTILIFWISVLLTKIKGSRMKKIFFALCFFTINLAAAEEKKCKTELSSGTSAILLKEGEFPTRLGLDLEVAGVCPIYNKNGQVIFGVGFGFDSKLNFGPTVVAMVMYPVSKAISVGMGTLVSVDFALVGLETVRLAAGPSVKVRLSSISSLTVMLAGMQMLDPWQGRFTSGGIIKIQVGLH